MVSLSAPWAQADHADRALFASIPVTAALLPQIDEAHRTLLSVQPKKALTDRAAEIAEAQRILDVRHDNIIRGCVGFLGGLIALTRDPALAKRLAHLQEVLAPEGLTATQKTYREESGQAALLASRLTPADNALLQGLHTAEGTLWEVIQEWIAIGAKLGKLEDERAALAQVPGPAPAEVVAARNQWIRTVNGVRTMLALVQARQPGVHDILNRLAEAERKADNRGAPGDTVAANPPATGAEPPAAPTEGATPGGEKGSGTP
ncbi:MAG: hypothetical protein ABJE95_02025 [Byssovorax sp.]